MVSPPEHYKRTYRIVSSKYPPISGFGTFRWGSRWISTCQCVFSSFLGTMTSQEFSPHCSSPLSLW